ncbi:tyrosine-type recombinase/integrase [Pseudonocardia sp. DSM 110487]|uniref:tyrosine-type recombinase/integrase n=1 Tax=Pseudonocardia sp. DSM 110487 TaxID=2865833 RepID=UPI001C69EEB2|nr:tyrosine-type recombinase/integrase [Pseudonocardia sp. DSM 110487]
MWRPGLVDIGPLTIHDLRHTYASWLIQDGVSIEQLSGLLGHAQISTTQRYSHLGQTQWSKVRAALDARAAPLLPHNDQISIIEDPQVRGLRRSTG